MTERLSSFSKLSVTLPTLQLILQPFCYFTYVTTDSPTILSLLLCHKLFTYVTWLAVHGNMIGILLYFRKMSQERKLIIFNHGSFNENGIGRRKCFKKCIVKSGLHVIDYGELVSTAAGHSKPRRPIKIAHSIRGYNKFLSVVGGFFLQYRSLRCYGQLTPFNSIPLNKISGISLLSLFFIP